jgi:uncharacterized protein
MEAGKIVKAVVFYEMGAAPMDTIQKAFPAHKALVDLFARQGKVIAIGTFADINDGAMGIFGTREHAEDFVRQDPFVLEGLVGKVTIKDWKETLLG